MRPIIMILFSILLVAAILLTEPGCKKDSNPVGVGSIQGLSFNSDRGNFVADGVFNDSATSGSGAQGFRSSQNNMVIAAYQYNSPTDANLVILTISDSGGLGTKTYPYGISDASALFLYSQHVNPHGSTPVESGYVLITGSVVISSLTSDRIQGTFSGTGVFSSNASQIISVTNGQFNIPYVIGSPKMSPGTN